jgi:hypothetical protein
LQIISYRYRYRYNKIHNFENESKNAICRFIADHRFYEALRYSYIADELILFLLAILGPEEDLKCIKIV